MVNKRKNTTEALSMKPMMEAAQTQTAIKTATSPRPDRNTQKNEMEINDENSIDTEKMGKESSGMEPWPQHSNQNTWSSGKTKKEMGR